MKKVDYKKELKHLYKSSAKNVEIVDVPKMSFLVIAGQGDPNNSEEFKESVEALFALSYTMKFMVKKEMEIDYGVMPLEGLWWVDDMSKFDVNHKEDWEWTVMIMQPELITNEILEKGKEKVKKKKDLKILSKIEFQTFREGKAAQTLHIGPFSEEGPTIRKVHDFITDGGGKLKGKHHEIYLSDIRRAAPEKWKTIIRQPME